MTFVILTGGIDLSVGSVVGLTGVILGLALHHFSIPVAIALATLAGAGIGLFSGLLIAYFDLAAFVITLGVMAIGRSLAYIFSGQTSISDIPAATERSRLHRGFRHPDQRPHPARALCARLGLPHLHQGRTHDLRGRLQPRSGAHRGPQRPVLQRRALCGLRRALRDRRDAHVVPDPVDRSARRHRARTRRHRRRGDRRREPLWRPGHDHRHADRRVHHGDDPQRPQSARRVAVLARFGDRRRSSSRLFWRSGS